jgi:transcriptional regulator with XRE-family HTH domain
MRRNDAVAGPFLDWRQSCQVSANVKALRAKAGVFQLDIALAAGISQVMVCCLEQGAYRWRERDAEIAAALLGTTLEVLLAEGGGAGLTGDAG